MAQSGSNRNTWIIAGSIVLAGLLVMIGILVVAGGNDDGIDSGQPGDSPSVVGSPSPTETPKPARSRSPRPTPTEGPPPSPSPSASPTVDAVVVLRTQTQKQAERDRPGEVKHIGQVDFYSDPDGCPQSGEAAAVYVRYTGQPKFAIYMWCRGRAHWKYHDGPIYGE